MSLQRITISLPNSVYQEIKKSVPSRGVSAFIVESIRKQLERTRIKKHEDVIDTIMLLRENAPKYSTKQIQDAVNSGRDT